MVALLRRAVARNPWTLGVFLLPLGLAWALRGRGEGVGLVGVYAGLALLLPPLVLALGLPLLAARAEWALLPWPPGRAFGGGLFGLFLGLLPPLALGLLAGGGLLGLTGQGLFWLLASGAGLLAFWTGLVGLAAALFEEKRALGLGFSLYGLLTVLYGPLVVELALRLEAYPLEGLLTLALLLNPVELHRVGLLAGLKAPVLMGPIGYLVAERLGPWGAWLSLAYLLGAGFGLALVGALIFARKDR